MRSRKLALLLACWLIFAVGREGLCAGAEDDPDALDLPPVKDAVAAPLPGNEPSDAEIQADAEKKALEWRKKEDEEAQEAEQRSEAAAKKKENARKKSEADRKAEEEKAADAREAHAAPPPPPPLTPLARPSNASCPCTGGESGWSDDAAETHYWSPLNFGIDIIFGSAQYKTLQLNSTGLTTGNYSTSGYLNFEWLVLKDFGKVAIGASAGVSVLSNVKIDTGTVNVNVFPLGIYLSYRLDFFRHQILVPYVRVGPDISIVPFSNTVNGFQPGGVYKGIDVAGGIELCLYFIAKHDSHLMDRQYGINDTFIVVEYLTSSQVGTGPNLAHNEVRGGLRFEF